MVRIAPVRLSFNPKTLWFDAGNLELKEGDAVVVTTVRGEEFGHVSDRLFDMDYEDTKKLKSPLKPVKRLAEPEDTARNEEVGALGLAALPVFRSMAAESVPDMHPIAVEYLFDGDKAVFYFEAEDRVDFRDLVRRLASEFHVRVDMKQIGVRDGARIVGGLGHCGQELCCRRLGGEFNPVSIRMAKEQDLSLNPQKISGLCGRLMCCLRYEYDAYKDFHGRAPKKNARIETPDGEGKVVDLDVPREVVSIKVGDEKPVKVPLAAMEAPKEGARPQAVGAEAWEEASAPPAAAPEVLHLFGSSQLAGGDELAQPGHVRHLPKSEGESKPKGRRNRRNRSDKGEGSQGSKQNASRNQRRRRSTTVSAEGSSHTEKGSSASKGSKGTGAKRNQRRSGSPKAEGAKTVQVGRNSSGLRGGRSEAKGAKAEGAKGARSGNGGNGRRRRRSHKPQGESSDK